MYILIPTEKRGHCTKEGENDISSDFTGYFLQVQKGKEVEIHHQDTIVDYKYHLMKPFRYQNVLGLEDKEERYRRLPEQEWKLQRRH